MVFPTSSLIAVFIFSFIIGMGAVVTPGPVSIAIVSQAPRRGWSVGPLVATGHSFLEMALVVLIVLGLTSSLASPAVRMVIALAGGLLLAWMGGSMLWGVWRGRIRLPRADEKLASMASRQLVGLGMVATISNPFWYAWWVTVAAGYLAQAQALSTAAVTAFYLGHITADYAWDTILSAVVGGGRQWMTDGVYRGLIVLCGAFFVYLGVVYLNQGFTLIH